MIDFDFCFFAKRIAEIIIAVIMRMIGSAIALMIFEIVVSVGVCICWIRFSVAVSICILLSIFLII